jgi:hypothetical protein
MMGWSTGHSITSYSREQSLISKRLVKGGSCTKCHPLCRALWWSRTCPNRPPQLKTIIFSFFKKSEKGSHNGNAHAPVFFFHVGFSCSQSFQILVCSTMLIHPFSCLSYILFGTLYSARWSVELLLRTFFHDVSKRRILSCMYHPIQSKSWKKWAIHLHLNKEELKMNLTHF